MTNELPPTFDLAAQAITAIDRAWEDGREKYPGDPWREKSREEHFRHIAEHIDDIDDPVDDNNPWPLMDIDHAIFRLCALRWQIENKKGEE